MAFSNLLYLPQRLGLQTDSLPPPPSSSTSFRPPQIPYTRAVTCSRSHITRPREANFP